MVLWQGRQLRIYALQLVKEGCGWVTAWCRTRLNLGEYKVMVG